MPSGVTEEAVAAWAASYDRITEAVVRRREAEAEFRAAILEAGELRIPMRLIAKWAEASHQRVHQIVQGARQGAHPPESGD